MARKRRDVVDGPSKVRTEAKEESDRKNFERKAAILAAGPLPVPEGLSDQYSVMWHVANNSSMFDVTENQKRVRQLRREDPGAFNSQLTVLEKDHTLLRKEKSEEGPVVEDGGTDRALAKVEELLGKLEVG